MSGVAIVASVLAYPIIVAIVTVRAFSRRRRWFGLGIVAGAVAQLLVMAAVVYGILSVVLRGAITG